MTAPVRRTGPAPLLILEIAPENSDMGTPKRMLIENIAWSRETSSRDPQFFHRLAERQQPRVLWIGCSDSRVPAERITNSQPGELFVHRDIANLVTTDEGQLPSVLEYAVCGLGVEHIVVCGHRNCGGVRAALTRPSPDMPALDRRIQVIRELAERHRAELEAFEDFDARADRLSELNVIEQVRRLQRAKVVCEAPRPPRLHGWIFGLREGLLTPLADVRDPVRH